MKSLEIANKMAAGALQSTRKTQFAADARFRFQFKYYGGKNVSTALPKAAVCAMFGATSAIKYRIMEDDGTTGWRWRGLLLEHGKFYPPEDGWQDRTYIVVQTDQKSIVKHYPIIKVED